MTSIPPPGQPNPHGGPWPGDGQALPPPGRRHRTALIVTLVFIATLILGSAGVATYFAVKGDDNSPGGPSASPTISDSSSPAPTGAYETIDGLCSRLALEVLEPIAALERSTDETDPRDPGGAVSSAKYQTCTTQQWLLEGGSKANRYYTLQVKALTVDEKDADNSALIDYFQELAKTPPTKMQNPQQLPELTGLGDEAHQFLGKGPFVSSPSDAYYLAVRDHNLQLFITIDVTTIQLQGATLPDDAAYGELPEITQEFARETMANLPRVS